MDTGLVEAGREQAARASLSAPCRTDVEELEAWRVLMGWTEGTTGGIPARLLVAHVLEVTPGADFAVQRAAFEAVSRRLAFRRRDELRVAERPSGGQPFGLYATRKPRAAARPYATLLRSVEPLRGSCDCRDFLRNSLGLCKHLLTVLEDLAGRPRRFQRARDAGAAPLTKRPRLSWCPVRPLTGFGDWLAQVRLSPGIAEAKHSRSSEPLLDDWLALDSSGSGVWVVRAAFRGDPRRRLSLVRALLSYARPPGRKPKDAYAAPDPALLALLERERAILLRRVALIKAAPALARALSDLKQPLYPYQQEGVERMLACGRLLLADDMGLGKTVQAIAVCHALYHAGKIRRGFLIVPASLKAQWLREWKLFSDVPVRILEGRPEERLEIYRETRAGFLIGNYALVRRDLEALLEWSPDLVVLDEAQRIKNWATKTAGAVKRLRPSWRLVLTGTPMENRLGELASILDWVDDRALEPKWRLGPSHTLRADGVHGAAVGAHNLNTLRERLAPCMLRRTRNEVLDQLPPRTDTTLPVELTEAQREAHNDLNQPIAQLASIRKRRPLLRAEFLRLMSLLTTQRIIANGLAQLEFKELWPTLAGRRPTEAVLEGLASPKLGALRDLIRQLAVDQGRKVVVFSQWRRMLTLAHWAVSDLLEKAGLRAAFFTGRESQRRRTRNIVDFHDDPRVCVLFATDAGGVGLNLQRAASSCINLELPWNPAVLEQRVARIHRMGQDRPIDVYNLVAPGCIEERIAATVSAKAALFKSVFDGAGDEVLFDGSGSFLEQICRPVAASAVEAPTDLDRDEQDRELDALIDAADETADLSEAPNPVNPGEERLEQAAPEKEQGRAPTVLPPAEGVRGLFRQFEISRTIEGGLRLEAPPEAAATLAALFEGLAGLLSGAADGDATR